ncbi:MAG: hypothetical protein JWO78_1808 [Micavibrio sp.]|nr:hypothetical protein [Micavibrio sp.]
MKYLLIMIAALSLLSAPALAAQGAKPDEGQLLVPPPMIEPANPDGTRCFFVHNNAPYTINGSVLSNYYTNLAGLKGRATSNFRLASGEKKQFCTNGPYYNGTRIGFLLRTVVPIFSCYTVAQGTIEVMGEFDKDKKSKTWAVCQ